MSPLPPAVLPLLLLGLTACSAGPLSAEDVATQAEVALEEESGVRPEVSCPEDLAAEVGARTRCTMTVADDPAEYGVQVTVTSIEDDRVYFAVDVDDRPAS